MAGAGELPPASALMGFVALILIGGAAAALLWRLGVARPLWSLVGAALMLGAAGYALQGRPLLPGHPVARDSAPVDIDPGIVQLRGDMLGRFGADGAYLVAADAIARSGDTGGAAQVILSGVRAMPDDVLLWTALGSALALHDGGQVSPPALFAFRRAQALAPTHPGPPFFTGLAYVQAGRFAEAEPYWRRALALTPRDAGYRGAIAGRLALLEGYLRSGAVPAR